MYLKSGLKYGQTTAFACLQWIENFSVFLQILQQCCLIELSVKVEMFSALPTTVAGS